MLRADTRCPIGVEIPEASCRDKAAHGILFELVACQIEPSYGLASLRSDSFGILYPASLLRSPRIDLGSSRDVRARRQPGPSNRLENDFSTVTGFVDDRGVGRPRVTEEVNDDSTFEDLEDSRH